MEHSHVALTVCLIRTHPEMPCHKIIAFWWCDTHPIDFTALRSQGHKLPGSSVAHRDHTRRVLQRGDGPEMPSAAGDLLRVGGKARRGQRAREAGQAPWHWRECWDLIGSAGRQVLRQRLPGGRGRALCETSAKARSRQLYWMPWRSPSWRTDEPPTAQCTSQSRTIGAHDSTAAVPLSLHVAQSRPSRGVNRGRCAQRRCGRGFAAGQSGQLYPAGLTGLQAAGGWGRQSAAGAAGTRGPQMALGMPVKGMGPAEITLISHHHQMHHNRRPQAHPEARPGKEKHPRGPRHQSTAPPAKSSAEPKHGTHIKPATTVCNGTQPPPTRSGEEAARREPYRQEARRSVAPCAARRKSSETRTRAIPITPPAAGSWCVGSNSQPQALHTEHQLQSNTTEVQQPEPTPPAQSQPGQLHSPPPTFRRQQRHRSRAVVNTSSKHQARDPNTADGGPAALKTQTRASRRHDGNKERAPRRNQKEEQAWRHQRTACSKQFAPPAAHSPTRRNGSCLHDPSRSNPPRPSTTERQYIVRRINHPHRPPKPGQRQKRRGGQTQHLATCREAVKRPPVR